MIIRDKEYTIKPTIRAMVIFETILGVKYNPQLVSHNIAYLYSLLMANAPDAGLTLDEFYDEVDKDPEFITRISEELARHEIPHEASDATGGGTAEKK